MRAIPPPSRSEYPALWRFPGHKSEVAPYKAELFAYLEESLPPAEAGAACQVVDKAFHQGLSASDHIRTLPEALKQKTPEGLELLLAFQGRKVSRQDVFQGHVPDQMSSPPVWTAVAHGQLEPLGAVLERAGDPFKSDDLIRPQPLYVAYSGVGSPKVSQYGRVVSAAAAAGRLAEVVSLFEKNGDRLSGRALLKEEISRPEASVVNKSDMAQHSLLFATLAAGGSKTVESILEARGETVKASDIKSDISRSARDDSAGNMIAVAAESLFSCRRFQDTTKALSEFMTNLPETAKTKSLLSAYAGAYARARRSHRAAGGSVVKRSRLEAGGR